MLERKKLLMEFGLKALMEQIPIPKPRPKPPEGSGYIPASSTGGITPAPPNTGTLGDSGPNKYLGRLGAPRVNADGNFVSDFEAMGLKLPSQRPTGSNVPKYRKMADAKSGIGGAIQRILGR